MKFPPVYSVGGQLDDDDDDDSFYVSVCTVTAVHSARSSLGAVNLHGSARRCGLKSVADRL